MTAVEIIGILLALIAILVALFIARRQAKAMKQEAAQITKLTEIGEATKRIGKETHDTAKTIRSDSYTYEVMKNFFGINQNTPLSYECFFPVIYDRRPLPYMAIGDYNALHIIQSLLGPKCVKLVPVEKNPVTVKQSTENNVIFLCTPHTNSALRAIAPPLTLSSTNTPILLGVEVPCWFADYEGKTVIYIAATKRHLTSPAEAEYERAAAISPGMPPEVSLDSVTDYAIILRTTTKEKKIVVVAGIHQYGTWIAGEFFRKLITPGALEPYESIFLSDQDFAAILWGEFNQSNYSVSRCNVLEEYIWIKKDNKWGRVEDKSTNMGVAPKRQSRLPAEPTTDCY